MRHPPVAAPRWVSGLEFTGRSEAPAPGGQPL